MVHKYTYGYVDVYIVYVIIIIFVIKKRWFLIQDSAKQNRAIARYVCVYSLGAGAAD